jgi:ABC-type transporter Mla subunit MlaD
VIDTTLDSPETALGLQHVLRDALATRRHASAILASLEDAQATCEGQLRSLRRVDSMKAVTGTSSIDAAIGQTRRMIAQLDRLISEARAGLPPHEQAAVESTLQVHVACRQLVG